MRQLFTRQFFANMALMSLLMVATQTVWATNASEAEAVIKDTTDKMLAALEREKNNIKNNPERLYSLVNQIVLPHFDFEKMSHSVLMGNWEKATDTQQERFIKAFSELLVRTYSTALVDAAGKVRKIYYKTKTKNTEKALTAIVKTRVMTTNQATPIEAEYAMYYDEVGKWKVHNVKVGGLSLVNNYREEFKDYINEYPDDPKTGLDFVIIMLMQKNLGAEK